MEIRTVRDAVAFLAIN